MKHRIVISVFLFVIVFANIYFVSSESDVNNTERPDVILIVADDLGFNDVPWHNTKVIAPNLQQLAEEGVILENSYVQPICTPTRAALLSGRYPFTIGRQDGIIWPLMPTGLTLDAPIIPQFLKPLGYETHAVGKWHVGFCNWSYTPTERGFDTFNGFYTGSEDYYTHDRSYSLYNYEIRQKELQGLFQRSLSFNESETTFIIGDQEYRDSWKLHTGYDFRADREPDFEARGKYSAYELTSRVEKILRTSSYGIPKFIYLPFQNVHTPLQVPKNYTDPYNYIKDNERRVTLGMVSALDEAVGRIVNVLKESGRYNNSVVIFTTDNGGATITGGNNWPLRGNKTTLWEGGTRGAAFIHSPLLKNPGRISNNLIHTTDWLATIVALAGGTPPDNTDSIDQWEALKETKEGPRKEMIYNINYNDNIKFQAGIRVKDYKLLVGDPGPGNWIPPPSLNETSDSEDDLKDFYAMARHWSAEDHMKYVMTLKSRCASLKCYENVLHFYSKSQSLNISGRTLVKIVSEIKRYKNVYKRWFKSYENENWRDFNLLSQRSLDFETTYLEEENWTLSSNISEYGTLGWALHPNTMIRLYDLKYDPAEKYNIAKEKPVIVDYLLKRLVSYRDRWVDPDQPKDDIRGNPDNWGGVWSPGWC